MEDRFAKYPLMDNRTGRVSGLDVRVEGGDTFVFTPAEEPRERATAMAAPEARREAFLDFSRIRAEAASMCARGGCGSFDDALAGALRSFAAVHGPLFGFAGLSDEKPEIREPIADWKAAQRVMESALKAEVFSRGGELDSSAIDERFKVTLVPGDEANRWSYVFDPGVVPSDLYRTCLKSSSVENYSTEDGSILRSVWHDGRESPATSAFVRGDRMAALFVTEYPIAAFGPVEWSAPMTFPLSAVRGLREIEAEVASLLKIVAGKHTGGVSLDFRSPMSVVGSKDEGAYGIVCTSYLSYMWHELSQAYSRNSFRVCANPKCENIISINDETSSGKRFCSERCRVQANNAKLSAQNTRAREAFYACKPYAEIYEEAFGKPLSFKDPERAKLCSRLDRWIERQFSKSAKGKAALKQGAARR